MLPLVACNCPGPPSPPEDARPDARVRDAGPKVTDAGADAGRRDAGRPEGRWIAVSGLPPGCLVERAANPAEVIAPLTFEPCAGVTGCTRLATEAVEGWLAVDDGYHDGTRGYFTFRARDPESRDRALIAAADDAGAVHVVYRSGDASHDCAVAGNAIGEGRVVLMLNRATDLGGWFVGCDLEDPAGTTRVLATHPVARTPGAFPQYLTVGAGATVYQVTSEELFRFGSDGEVTRIEDGSGSPIHGLPGSVVGAEVVFDARECCRNRIMIDGPSASPVALVDPIDPEEEASVHHRTDGRTLGWFQGWRRRSGGTGTDFERIDVYGAEYASTPGEIRPMRLGTMQLASLTGRITAGFGHVAVLDPETPDPFAAPWLLRLFRLADGSMTVLTVPAGAERWTKQPVYIGPRTMLVTAGDATGLDSVVQVLDLP